MFEAFCITKEHYPEGKRCTRVMDPREQRKCVDRVFGQKGTGWPEDSVIQVSWTQVTLKSDQHGGKRARGHAKEPEGHVGAMTGGAWRSRLRDDGIHRQLVLHRG